MADTPSSIIAVFDYVWGRTRARLDGLTDAEYLWEPAPGGWTLRQDASGRWRIDADGGGGAPPDPLPVTTIAWRLGHVGMMLIDYGTRLFEGGTITIDDVEFPGAASGVVPWLEWAYETHWRTPLAALPAEDWWKPVGPAFFRYADAPTVDMTLHVLDELIHHTAEVGVLRDLYPHRT